MSVKNLIATIALMSLSTLACAVGDDLYVAVDIGRSTYRNACTGVSTTFTTCSDYDLGHRVSFGWDINPFTSAEIGYYSAGQTIAKGAGMNSDAIDDVEWQFSGIKFFPIGDGRFLVFGRLGIAHWEATKAISTTSTRISASGNEILWGIGAKYFLTSYTSVRLQYEFHRAGNSSINWRGDVNFASAGLVYKF